jgi:excisionase family DNA binding protein
MGGLGEYRRAQMKRVDPRVSELFHHLRNAIDILEQIALHPYSLPTPNPPFQARPEKPADPPPPNLDPAKLAYTVKEVRKLIGVSHTKLCRAMQNKELRAVKYGHRTLILATDLQAWMDAWPERG